MAAADKIVRLTLEEPERQTERVERRHRKTLTVQTRLDTLRLLDRQLDRPRRGDLRLPGPDLTAPFGWRYTSVDRFRPGESVSLLDVPAAPLAVAALLP